ncbi:MAG TPA: TMEM165/GDT1 family protein [bacterium]|nr:TMEM165/GDT1 family protein [bacterium]HPN31523.1 TMEM165/GDT1 family protein [bacterium]
MNWKLFAVTFASIFLAELGDKTQLATISFTADNVKFKWIVFFAAASALVFTTFIGVFFGHIITKIISPKLIKIIAAVLFIIIGAIMLYGAASDSPENSKIQKLSAKIREIQNIEKCRYCTKFNEFISDNCSEATGINPEKGGLHPPYNCDDCNTEALKKIL